MLGLPMEKQHLNPKAGYEQPPGGGTPYNGLYGEAPPERSTFFRLQVYERVGVSRAEVYEREGNLSFRYLKGPLIKIFRVNAPYDCIT